MFVGCDCYVLVVCWGVVVVWWLFVYCLLLCIYFNVNVFDVISSVRGNV